MSASRSTSRRCSSPIRSFPTIVTSALARSGLIPGRLELEITEGVFLDDSRSSDAMFPFAQGAGRALSLDDFGTGYSSLGYLRNAPFDKIKIDQSFVRGAAQPGSRNIAIIRAIVTLAETLGMETTAEGVEAQDELLLIATWDAAISRAMSMAGRCAVPRPGDDDRPRRSGGGDRRPHHPGGADQGVPSVASRAERGRARRPHPRHLSGGAMIDGLTIDQAAVGVELLIELVENQMFAARIRWAGTAAPGSSSRSRSTCNACCRHRPARCARDLTEPR